MAGRIKDIHVVDDTSFPYIFEQNVSIPLKSMANPGPNDLIRCNVYRPKAGGSETAKRPVLITFGPYGKDIHYKDFHPKSFSEVNPRHKSEHSCWETPDPAFWVDHGYVVVRADERGSGQSPGVLDTMSRSTSEAFFDLIEWAAVQPWSTGKVGLLGISYYAGSQWRVAARRPLGLKAIIPWEGMSDYYRDRCRHGGILANSFITFWWNRQVVTNQYGRPGRKASNWGPDTVEGDLPTAELEHNRRDQTQDNVSNRYRDEEYYSSKEYALEDIEVPLLSVANWGGLYVHLRGNVEGFTHAGSELKYLRFITGRHDLPLYYDEEVEIQRSFLDAFLKDDDRVGWSVKGAVPKVDLILRKGDVPVNNPEAERHNFKRRTENEWPIARTQYTKYYLTPDKSFQVTKPSAERYSTISYAALCTEENPQLALFTTAPFVEEVEITGHITAHLNVSLQADPAGPTPSDIDLFVTLRHISADGKEICYTGSAGDPTPATKGWLRVSLRKVNEKHVRHRPWLPQRDYFSTDMLPVIPGEVYGVDVEILPTNIVVEKGARLAFEVASGDTSGVGIFKHNHPEDRPASRFQGINSIRFGPQWENYVVLPIIP